jgi:hypothetical protein
MRRLLILAALVGCAPSFQDDEEELHYLNSQAKPTVEQFRRRAELDEKIGRQVRETELGPRVYRRMTGETPPVEQFRRRAELDEKIGRQVRKTELGPRVYRRMTREM